MLVSLRDDIDKENSAGAKRLSLGRIAELLERNGIDIDEIGAIKRVSLYQAVTKDTETGEASVHDLTGVQFSPKWETGPEWPVVQQGPAVKLPAAKATKAKSGWPVAVVLPDIQCGYFSAVDGSLEAIHDERAISVALSILADVNPDLVVLVGDNLDFAELGKYIVTKAYQQTTQATIDRATTLAAQIRAAAPNAKIIWLAGNHEERLPKFLLQNASAAFGLKRGALPESWPVMSVPFLCRLDEVDIEYRPGYPASSVWITERLRVIHGDRVASGGSTAHKYLGQEKSSVIYGHIHRREWAERTREDHDGPRTVLAASPGCLCRVDGAVPSTRGGTDLNGRPLTRYEDWQQGLAVIPYDPESGRFCYEQIAIHDGWAMYRGKEYKA
ncbi:Calcineurin-like phosphoesterase domain, lpxH type [uncultured Caudovirales phage]|uniref:Calcineurin-like phosphoesterase domain, lpxH type n=1 Tax=uncultured Caudovirales phage TaxID=2100421 RepID=A0A6J5NAN5_9CAUD|nr:Calcineurin-like phosphoesterase domain, lpxH type [uncultured Caudovirales phage]